MRFSLAYSLLFLRSRFPVLSTSGTAILTAAVILAGSGGCLYTDPINRPPTITIVQLMTEIFRGEDAVFQADASDPEGDLSTVEWVRDDARACPRGPRDHLDRKNWPVGVRHAGRIFEVAGQDTEAPFCLWAFATDAEGAVTAAEPLQVNPKSHAPVAKIEVIDPVDPSAYSMYADVKLSAHGSTADALATPTWKVVAPPGSSVMDLECSSELDPQIACLTPDIPGKYLIELTVRNPDGAMSMTSLPVQVLPDRLPCIANLAPAALAIRSRRPIPCRRGCRDRSSGGSGEPVRRSPKSSPGMTCPTTICRSTGSSPGRGSRFGSRFAIATRPPSTPSCRPVAISRPAPAIPGGRCACSG
ncbi:MAG: hypothetical protein ABUL77_04215 [Bacteroidota bacterium]